MAEVLENLDNIAEIDDEIINSSATEEEGTAVITPIYLEAGVFKPCSHSFGTDITKEDIYDIFPKVGFAIYSDDDNSLTFYAGSIPPDEGSIYNQKTATNVYTEFTTTNYSESNLPEWHEIAEFVKTISFDESFKEVKPRYTSYWFYEMKNCINIDIKNLDTSLVKDMHDTFSGLESLEELDVSNLDVRNVTRMYGVFYDCIKLTTIDISNWQTNSLTDAHGMFDSCSSLITVDVSNLNTSKVKDMGVLFRHCYALQTIYSNDNVFVTDEVTSSSNMFVDDTNLVGGNGTKYDSSKVDSSMAHIDTASNPGYFTEK